MGTLRQIGGGFLLGALSVAIVLGGFALAMAEDGLVPAIAPTITPTLIQVEPYPTLELLSSPYASEELPQTETPIPTNTFPPPPTTCLPPEGWVAISIQPFDTLTSIAAAYRISPIQLQQANCLVSNELVTGSFLYVPPTPPNTVVACGAPAGWAIYIVQPGDTLYRISLLYRVSVGQLQQANCLGGSTAIYSGQQLRVPNVPTSTATFTQTPTSTPTETATGTPTLGPSPTWTVAPPTSTETPAPSVTPENTTPPPTQESSSTP
jgi:peptidoglycan endopeptidase LytF